MFTHHTVKKHPAPHPGYGIVSSHKTFEAAQKKAVASSDLLIVNFDSEFVDLEGMPTGGTVDIQFIREHRTRYIFPDKKGGKS